MRNRNDTPEVISLKMAKFRSKHFGNHTTYK